MTDPAPLPLAGCRVLDLTRALSGPYCTMILGDLGADVIKVEQLENGDMIRSWGPFAKGISVFYLSTNRNKRDIAIDFRTPGGLDVIRDLARGADVIVENFKVGVMEEMGLGYDALSAANPRLIYASVTGLGRGGPDEKLPALDQVAQGISGLMSITGTEQTSPLRVGLPIADLTAGLWVALGVSAAMIQRQATGRGQRVEASLLGSLISMLSFQGQRYLTLGEVAAPAGNDHPILAVYGAFETANGLLNIAAGTEAMWQKLCSLLDLDALAQDPRFNDNAARMQNRETLRSLLEGRLRSRTKEEWTTILVGAGIPVGPINKIDEALDNPHVRMSGSIATVEHPTLGLLEQLTTPIRLGGSVPQPRRPPPLLGQHTVEILREAGFSADRIKALLEGGIVKQSTPP